MVLGLLHWFHVAFPKSKEFESLIFAQICNAPMLLSGVLEQEGSGGTPPLSLLEVSKRGTRMRYSSNSFVEKGRSGNVLKYTPAIKVSYHC